MQMNDNLSHSIEKYILECFEDRDEENFISLRRKELAEMFGCVPSQINYVLRSRFNPQHGYLIESRRGEYGYIKILRISCDNAKEKVNHVNDLVGSEISTREASRLLETLKERNFITNRERLLIEIALKDQTRFSDPEDNATLLKKMLNVLMSEE